MTLSKNIYLPINPFLSIVPNFITLYTDLFSFLAPFGNISVSKFSGKHSV